MYAIDSEHFVTLGDREVLTGWRLHCVGVIRRFRYRIDNGLPFSKNPFGMRGLEYQTMYGPCFYHPGTAIYKGRSTHNVGMALQRITQVRENEEELTRNNKIVSPKRNPRRLQRFLNNYYLKVKNELERYYGTLQDSLTEQIKLACQPHVKRKLRIKAIKTLIRYKDMIETEFMTNIKGKIKIPEFAKVGKRPRLLGDYSTEGSLLAAFLVPLLKHAFSKPIEMHNAVIQFVYSTDANELDEIFARLSRDGRDVYIFYSDDCCTKLYDQDEGKWFNIDISSCDASNGPGVFSRLEWFFDFSPEWCTLVKLAVKQNLKPYIIQNPTDVNEWVRCVPSVPIEFSGTQLTTLLNNIASSAISCSIAYARLKRKGVNRDVLINCAKAVGYNITVEACAVIEDVQFLKHSFWEDERGAIRSFCNLGAYLRSIGSCWRDLPYSRKRKENLEDAARVRNKEVLAGFVHCGQNRLYTAMRKMPGANPKTDLEYRRVKESVNRDFINKPYFSKGKLPSRQAVPDTVILRRYNLELSEWIRFCKEVESLDVCEFLADEVVHKILEKDYSLKRIGCYKQ